MSYQEQFNQPGRGIEHFFKSAIVGAGLVIVGEIANGYARHIGYDGIEPGNMAAAYAGMIAAAAIYIGFNATTQNPQDQ